ncbi:hypothetical protein [Aliikangiella coralliicola]|uniref:Uncharacterized protein n=1 Tax=Aliikangiella coralliicola TaxID=2592383 RepID=A0A545UI68_9GAMM|nr:hypothetical protein [Aliikangiella coralliicola]TQV89164.1 hypothetical protein FLL46_03275 [Aliikangiella coralliicola]
MEQDQNNLPEYQNTQQILKEQVVPQRPLPSLSLPQKSSGLKEANEYRSAGVLMRRLADTITQWRQQLPEDEEPAILAVMYGGIQINVERLAQESFHGIRIEGNMNGSPCMLLAHQSTVQMLCFVKKVEQQAAKRRIGFIIDGEEEEV